MNNNIDLLSVPSFNSPTQKCVKQLYEIAEFLDLADLESDEYFEYGYSSNSSQSHSIPSSYPNLSPFINDFTELFSSDDGSDYVYSPILHKLSINPQLPVLDSPYQLNNTQQPSLNASSVNEQSTERLDNRQKNFPCDTCGKPFAKRYHLRAHEKVHSERSIFCTKCPSKFTRKYDMRRHMDRVHKILIHYKCVDCRRVFDTDEELQSHKQKTHRKLREEDEVKDSRWYASSTTGPMDHEDGDVLSYKI